MILKYYDYLSTKSHPTPKKKAATCQIAGDPNAKRRLALGFAR